MTIARRLMVLLAVPLLILVGLGIFVHSRLESIRARSTFLVEMQIPGLAQVGAADVPGSRFGRGRASVLPRAHGSGSCRT